MTLRRPALALLGLTALALVAVGVVRAAEAPPVDRPPTWASLSPQQQQVLTPLRRDWATIEPDRKQKWIEVARRFPALPAAERQRVQERMAEWARMTPAERGRARLQFQQSRQIPAEDRQARWEAYKALPDEEREELARRAKPASAPQAAPKKPADARGTETAAKRNVLTPSGPAPLRPVAPTVVQAKPGATTTLITQKGNAPLHQQAGRPKIAATQPFVDPQTLLPRRGPQGAAVVVPLAREDGADTAPPAHP